MSSIFLMYRQDFPVLYFPSLFNNASYCVNPDMSIFLSSAFTILSFLNNRQLQHQPRVSFRLWLVARNPNRCPACRPGCGLARFCVRRVWAICRLSLLLHYIITVYPRSHPVICFQCFAMEPIGRHTQCESDGSAIRPFQTIHH